MIAFLRFLDGLTFPEAIERLTGMPAQPIATTTATAPARDLNIERVRIANRIWSEATDPPGTAAEAYLKARGLDLPPDACGTVLRFNPACPWAGGRLPAMIAAFRNVATDQLTGSTRIRLDLPALWPKVERKMIGIVMGAAIKLLPPAGGMIAIAEGIENAMAANQLGFGPAWALGSVNAIAGFDPPAGITRIRFIGENDDHNPPAVQACVDRLRDRGITFIYARPPHGVKDFNDCLERNGAC